MHSLFVVGVDTAPAFGSIQGIIITLVVGGLIGWVASILMKTNAQMGLIANIVIGIVGAFIGGWLGGLLGISIAGWVGSLVLALGGAVLLIIALRFLRVLR